MTLTTDQRVVRQVIEYNDKRAREQAIKVAIAYLAKRAAKGGAK